MRTMPRAAIGAFGFRVLGSWAGPVVETKPSEKVVEAAAFTLEGDDDASPAEAEVRYRNVEIAAS